MNEPPWIPKLTSWGRTDSPEGGCRPVCDNWRVTSDKSPTAQEYKGVFDLPDSAGLTPSERILAQLSRRAFLSLWTFPNLHTDEGFKAGSKSPKEFADGLLMFGNDVVLFSDKEIAFNEEKPIAVAWPRWYRKAVTHSEQQLFGALSWVKRFPDRIFLDPGCTRKLPVPLPATQRARYHLVAVTRGTYKAVARHFPGSLGTLLIRTDIVGDADPHRPFSVGLGPAGKPFVHILDEFALEVILREFDTASDFLIYLKARERFLGNPDRLIIAPGEEQLVAAYLLNMRGDDHWFISAPGLHEKEPDLISFDESHFKSLRNRPEYRAKKEADNPSYVWDELIERFIRLGDPKLAGDHFKQTSQELEEGLRIIASESRFHRRLLARALRDALVKAVERPGRRFARVVTAAQDPDRVYIFLILPARPGEPYEDYRRYRVATLHAYCRCAQLRFSDATTFIGIGIDHPVKDYEGSSEDLFIYQPKALTEDEKQEAEKFRAELGILPDDLKAWHSHDDEFPSAPPASAGSLLYGDVNPDTRRRAGDRKRKRKLVKEARRKNRRKK